MNDKPRILTVAEIDALAGGGSGWCGEESFASLCRMARAMAVMQELNGSVTTNYIPDGFWYAALHDKPAHVARAAGPNPVEAIEATEEP